MKPALAMNDDWQKRRRGKNLALLAVLVAMVVLLFFVTMARLGMLLK
jgi:hypothetical protein